MFLNKGNIISGFLEKKLTSYNANLINTNPAYMKKICKEHPEYIKYARGAAITTELIDIVLNHPDFEKAMLYEALAYYGGISSDTEVMKKLCAIDASYFSYCKGATLTYEIYEIAKNAPEPKFKILEENFCNMDFYKVSPKEMLKFLKIDGRLISKIDIKKITKEMVEIALSNPNENKRPSNYDLSELRFSKKHMRYLCEIDGLYFLQAYDEAIDADLIRLAINHPDPEKRLTIERIPEGYEFEFDYKKIKDLVEKDERWLKYVDLETIGSKELLRIIKTNKVVPTAKIIETYKNNPEVLELILSEAKNNSYSLTDMKKMLKFQLDRKFINSNFFNEFTKILCEKAEIDHNFFKYIVERSISFNNEILTTLNYELLNSRFHRIYEGNGYEKLYSLCVYKDIQDMIVEIGTPIDENGKIDYELGDKRLELLNRLLKSSLIDKNGNKIVEWIPYYNKIIQKLYSDKNVLEYFSKHINELDENRIRILTNHILGGHSFSIKSVEDLDNYEEIRNKWIEEKTNSYSMRDIKDAAFEKVFGISMTTAEEFKPYCEGILLRPEEFHPHIVEFIKVVDQILKEDNVTLLRETIKSFERSQGLDEKGIIHLRTLLKKQYVKEYNDVLFTTHGKTPDHVVGGIKMYKAAGKSGKEDFSLVIHAVGAYMGTNDATTFRYNFKEDWNRPQIYNHGICSSFIAPSNLGTALTRSVIYGFTDYEEGSLLLSGPTDIYSSNESFDTMGDEDKKSKYLLPREMIDHTRHTHNEIVFERRVENQKRQPSYIVLMVDDYNKAMLKYRTLSALGRYTLFKKTLQNGCENTDADAIYFSLKAAQDFGVPIVVVEREKIAKHQHEQIRNKLEEFKNDTEMNRDEVKEYFHDIIVTMSNNHAGNRNYHSKIDDRYFSYEFVEEITCGIKEKISECMKTNPSLALIMLEELEKVMEMELYKCSSIYEGTFFPAESIIDYCKEEKKNLRFATREDLNISCVFDGSMNDVDNLMEYNRWVTGKVPSSQYYLSDIREIVDDSLLSKILLCTEEFEKEGLYKGREKSAHSRRHIENVILFSAVIGQLERIEDRDMDLLLNAALYHDTGRVNDIRSPHAVASSKIAYDKLHGKIPNQDLQIIRAAIEYHEVVENLTPPDYKVDEEKLNDICSNLGMDITDKKVMERTKKIACILKDADALDRTRFLAESKSFVNKDFLHYNSSKLLIKFANQLNEHYAAKDIEQLCATHPELFDEISKTLEETKNPKYTIRLYRKGEIKKEVVEEVNTHGTKK